MGYYDESGNWVEGEPGEGGTEVGSDTPSYAESQTMPWDLPGQTYYDCTVEGMDGEWEALDTDGGVVTFEWVDAPALVDGKMQYHYKVAGGRQAAKKGAVVASIALLKKGAIFGTSTTKLGQDLGPNDTGQGNLSLYSSEDGEYEVNITIGGVAKHFKYHVASGTVTAA